MPRDGPADVEDRRAAQAEVGEEHGLAVLLRAARSGDMDRGDHVGEAQPLQARDPVGRDPERHQGRPRLDDRVAEPPRDRIAVARRAAARVRLPPTATITRRAVTVESGSGPRIRSSARLRLRSARSEHRALAAETSLLTARAGARAHRARRRRGPRPGRSCRCPRPWSRRRLPRTSGPSHRRRTGASAGPRNAPLSPNACWMARMPRDCAGS